MKKISLISAAVITSLLLTSISHAADTVQEKISDGEIQKQDVAQQNNLFHEIQKGYITQLRRINSDLLNIHTILAGNYYASKLANARMQLSLARGTRVPAYVGEVLENLSNQRANMDTEIKESEKKKDALNFDVNSFYSDKLPEWFSKEWDQEVKEYTESLNLIYETTSELIEKR